MSKAQRRRTAPSASRRSRPPARRTTTRRRPAGRQPRRRPPGRLRRLTAGDRLYVFVLIGVVAGLAVMALGPLQNYTAAADRADRLLETRDQLQERVDRLEERRERLHDLEEVELLARRDLGLVKPGEVPFVVVEPESELDQLSPQLAADEVPPDGGPWYRRLGRWLGELLR